VHREFEWLEKQLDSGQKSMEKCPSIFGWAFLMADIAYKFKRVSSINKFY